MKDNNAKINSKSLESLYLEKDFDGAREYLLKHRDDFSLGQYHFNLGTIHMKLEQFAEGRYHLEKALKEGYVNTNSFHNLDVVKSILAVDDIGNSDIFSDKIMSKAKEMPDSVFFAITLLIIVLIGFIVRFKFITRKWMIATFVTLSLFPLGYKFLYLDNTEIVIALKDIQLHEGPSKMYSETSLIKAGSKVITGKRSDNWVFIKAPLKYAGWAESTDFGAL